MRIKLCCDVHESRFSKPEQFCNSKQPYRNHKNNKSRGVSDGTMEGDRGMKEEAYLKGRRVSDGTRKED